jgi:pyruvate/2-oxoglutarate dehydrogenase complex dihydrolipoamide dehydrogenase (E3) component
MVSSTHYDVLIVGSGQAGGPLATAFATTGRRVALVEREHIGGTCINDGCTPTKTLIASGRIAYLTRRAADYGVRVDQPSIDMVKVRDRKRTIVEKFRGGSQSAIEKGGVEIIFGEARFSGPRAVDVALDGGGERSITADLICINTGGRPSRPPLEGLDAVSWLDSTSVMELDVVPDHLLVLGGGYIGLEFGQLYRRLGSRVTVIQRGDRLFAREDDDVCRAVASIMEQDGLELLYQAGARSVESDEGRIRMRVELPSGERVLDGSHLLVAVGRTPNTDQLNLQAAGVEVNERQEIVVNERLETTADGVYAMGDVKGGPQFTHISYDDFRIVKKNLIDGGTASTANRLVPYTVYIDPQLGRVGMTEAEARKRGHEVRVASMKMSHVARAIEVDEPRGLLKAVVDARTDKILGFAALSIEGGEIMSMVEIAMMGDLPWQALRNGIFAHPTLAESLNNLFASLEK